MNTKIYLCSHLYCAYDPILALSHLQEKNIIHKKEKVLIVTTIKFLNNLCLDLNNINYEIVLTSNNNFNATKKIIEKIKDGYSICIFYPEYNIKPGILKIMKSDNFKINYNFEVYTVNIKINNSLPIDMSKGSSFLGLSTIILSNINLLFKSTKNKVTVKKWNFDVQNTQEEEFLRTLEKKLK